MPNEVFDAEPNARAPLLARLKEGAGAEPNPQGLPNPDDPNEAPEADVKGVPKIEGLLLRTDELPANKGVENIKHETGCDDMAEFEPCPCMDPAEFD